MAFLSGGFFGFGNAPGTQGAKVVGLAVPFA